MPPVPPRRESSLSRDAVERRLVALCAEDSTLLRQVRMGVERETLRVSPEGLISQTPHPRALGSALTHPFITTDYAEPLLEFVTPVFGDRQGLLGFLRDAHAFAIGALGDEYLWGASMPCVLNGPASIPIAQYGPSNPGRMKTLYRVGLGHRYGRMMQVIAGVHFNFSLDDGFWTAWQRLEGVPGDLREVRDRGYMGLIRNLQRIGWLVPYLFGNSPAVCRTFAEGVPHRLEELGRGTLYQRYATSLRMGDIGYTNERESGEGVKACYDDLGSYIASLRHAIETPCPAWERIGVQVDGEYRQLNANILQIENEYYSTIRPKQPPHWMEKPSLALERRGIRYVELRSPDVDVFHPLGVGPQTIRFLELLMLYCLLDDSPVVGEEGRREIDRNLLDVANRGREPGLRLMRGGQPIALVNWAGELFDGLEAVAVALDTSMGTDRALREGGADRSLDTLIDDGLGYRETLASLRVRVGAPDLTPSARMLDEMRDQGESFSQFVERVSQRHKAWLQAQLLSPETRAAFEDEAAASIRRQAELERADPRSFDDFLADYFHQDGEYLS